MTNEGVFSEHHKRSMLARVFFVSLSRHLAVSPFARTGYPLATDSYTGYSKRNRDRTAKIMNKFFHNIEIWMRKTEKQLLFAFAQLFQK